MKKMLLLFNVVLFLNVFSNAQSTDRNYYLTTNTLSPFAGINKNSATANALLPIFSNMEYGFTISGGCFKKYQFWETRLTIGKSNEYNFIPQIQFGKNIFIFDYLNQTGSGWYIGGFVRYQLYHNKFTKTNLNNFTENMTIGYMWKKKKIICDFRISLPVLIYSISDIENTKSKFEFNFSPMPQLSPVLPFFSFNIGFKFE